MFSTVGELKKELEKYDDNTPIRLYLSWYDRNNYQCARVDLDEIKHGQGLSSWIEDERESNGCITIANENSKDIEMAD